MGTELTVTCVQGLTGLAFGETVRITELGELQPPPAWTACRTENPGRGTAEIDGRKVRFENDLVEGGAPGRLQLRGKILPWPQRGADAGGTAGSAGAQGMCFADTGSGDHVVGTWIAEGGG